MNLLQDVPIKADFARIIEEGFEKRKAMGTVQDRWKEMKQTIIDPAKNIYNGRGRNKRSGFVMIRCKSMEVMSFECSTTFNRIQNVLICGSSLAVMKMFFS